MVAIGKEKEFVRYRLKDIIYLAEHTIPVDGDWEGYAKSICRILANQAREANQYLELIE